MLNIGQELKEGKVNFQTHNDKNISIGGTYLLGYIDIKYSKLVKIFGEPFKGDGHKVDVEWNIEFEDGLVATIYNYKNGKNYLGKEGLEVNNMTSWNVGGKDEKVVERIEEIIKEA